MSNETGIACEEGKYSNFSGVIMWGKTESVVENATFELEECFHCTAIVWHKGIWLNGVWENGDWKSGTWKDGRWENGIWKHGKWCCGRWLKGIWENGVDSGGGLHLNNPNNWRR